MAPFVTVDTSQWPTALVTFRTEPNDMQEFETYLQQLDNLYNKKSRFNLVFDATEIGSLPMLYLMKQITHMRQNEKLSQQWIYKAAIIFNQQITLQLIDFLLHLSKPVVPVKCFPTFEDAFEWLYV